MVFTILQIFNILKSLREVVSYYLSKMNTGTDLNSGILNIESNNLIDISGDNITLNAPTIILYNSELEQHVDNYAVKIFYGTNHPNQINNLSPKNGYLYIRTGTNGGNMYIYKSEWLQIDNS